MTPRKLRTEQAAAPQVVAPKNNGRPAAAPVDPNQYFFGESLVGVRPEELSGTLVVVEGMDGSGRSTQIALLQEWLESEGFPGQTTGFRRVLLVGEGFEEPSGQNGGEPRTPGRVD